MATVFTAVIWFALPVGLFSYLAMGWLMKEGKLPASMDRKALKEHMKTMKKEGEIKKLNPIFKKWMDFGGGFYGAAAVYTYMIVETGEVLGFIFKMLNPDNWTFDIGLDLLIRLIIETFSNLLLALLWFTYWPSDNSPFAILIYFLAAYVAFQVGAHLASTHLSANTGHMRVWPWWRSLWSSDPSNEPEGQPDP